MNRGECSEKEEEKEVQKEKKVRGFKPLIFIILLVPLALAGDNSYNWVRPVGSGGGGVADTTCDGNTCDVTNTGTLDGYEGVDLLDDTNASSACPDGEYLDGDSNCYHFNNTVSALLTTTYYNATNATAEAGTIDDGFINYTQHPDGSYDDTSINFSEVAASPGLDIRINFTNVSDFNGGVMRYYTSTLKGEYPLIQLWDYADSEWEDYPVLGESLSWSIIQQQVFDSTNHLSGGIVQMRLYKASIGNTNNNYFVDWIAVYDGVATPSGEETDPYSVHREGDVELTNDWDAGDFNITARYFFADDWSNVTITESQVTDLTHTVNESTRMNEIYPILINNYAYWNLSYNWSNANHTNWDTAFGWGDHSAGGYLTAESDPKWHAEKSAFLNISDDTNITANLNITDYTLYHNLTRNDDFCSWSNTTTWVFETDCSV